ncbi:MAG: outer membrane beta-barrel protein [Bdellovibrionaceae bacterium]|nr:outer membrane beta-barrel protein [Pseudobdellovibrionaceae bacterium]
MNKVLISLMTLCLASFAQAADFGVEVGFRQQSGSVDSGLSAQSQMGYQVGAVGVFPISGALGVRTGLMYVNRPLVVKNDLTSAETKVSLNYFEVPVALSYAFEDYASVFGGVALSMHLDSNATNGAKVKDEKSPIIPLIVGASFKFAPQLGATLFFESGSGDVADGLKNYRAVGANLLISFE